MEMTEKIKSSFNEISKNIGTMNMNEIISFAWGAKEILRDDFKKTDWGKTILPFMVLRRLGRVLEPTKDKVLKEIGNLKGSKPELVEARLNQITGYPFHNRSKYNLELLIADPNNIHKNTKSYIRGFSENIRDVFDNFKFDNTIDELYNQKILYQFIQHFASSELDFDPKKIDNHMMGTIYEEVIRRANEATNEEAGHHFTPREVIRLMVNILFSPDIIFRRNKREPSLFLGRPAPYFPESPFSLSALTFDSYFPQSTPNGGLDNM